VRLILSSEWADHIFAAMKIGIIGCGNISDAYFNGGKQNHDVEVKACADLNMETAQLKAEEHGCLAQSVDGLLADDEIELIINLTIPRAHAEVGLKAVEAGKHTYSEKPFALNMEEGRKLLERAAEKGVRVGCAPDTFLFGNGQTARKIIDDGWIGQPFGGIICMACPGHERWHPNPGFYYDHGGGPMLDMGPYYLHALVNYLGPIKSVCGKTATPRQERIATSEGAYGQRLEVKVPTHLTGVLEFHNGAVITAVMSFDVWGGECPRMQIFGTAGTLFPGDPNNFPNLPRLKRYGDSNGYEIPATHPANARMIGVVDMAEAIRQGRPHRVSGELALHVLEAMLAFEQSAQSGEHITLTTTASRPEALPPGLLEWQVD
jgi:predicted dehydrogenase